MTDFSISRGSSAAARDTRQTPGKSLSPLRSLASDLLRVAVFPVYQRRQTPAAFTYLRELRGLEFASAETIETMQWDRLAGLLKHAAKNVPYYRDAFRENGIAIGQIRTAQDFARIPVLTKSALKESGARLLADSGDTGGRRNNASGGSTGRPVQFYQDRFYWEFARASQWFVEGWWGIRPGDRTASVWGCDRDLPDQSWRERLTQEICQVRTCNAFAITERRMEEFARMLMIWRPRFMTGYASALQLFASFLLGRPDLRISPLAVKSTAEVLMPEQRSLMEAAFECPVYNFYGSREVNNLAAECPAHSGLHVNTLGRYVEIVDEYGHPVPAGISGRLLVTDLTNFAMPFIRYEIEDIGTWAEKTCACGRPFPLLAEVKGRSSDFITIPDGRIIHGEYFTHLFYDFPQVSSFQMLQSALSDIRVDIALKPGIADFPLAALRGKICDFLGPQVNCEINVVPKIERSISGKHRFTISSVRVPWSSQVRGRGERD